MRPSRRLRRVPRARAKPAGEDGICARRQLAAGILRDAARSQGMHRPDGGALRRDEFLASWPMATQEELLRRGSGSESARPQGRLAGTAGSRHGGRDGQAPACRHAGVKSGLDRHQWLRNGTCQTANAEDYFALQLRLLDELNRSAVRALFADAIGKELDEKQIKQAFDQGFGAGAGDRVRMRCQSVNGRDVITGLTIGLSGDLSGKAELADLIQAAGPTEFKCAKGIADAAGRG